MRECYLSDDGGPEVIAVETAPEGVRRGSLWVRVGPVFDGNLMREEPGVWIGYQADFQDSSLMGPVLLTPEVWRQLNRAVEYRLRTRWRHGKWRTRLHGVLRRG